MVKVEVRCDLQVAGIAHQVQRCQPREKLGQPGQGALDCVLRFDLGVALGAQRNQVREPVSEQVVRVCSGPIVKGAEGP